ncbi:MAG: hypothetical protein ABIJ34_06175 [archaeon]
MLEKAIFRKHTNLFLYMISREHFSQKEIIHFSLENHEFKDKDSWENKGQFRDKLINLGLLKKYSFREFKERYPSLAEDAGRAYEKSHERKRIILSFDSTKLLGMALPSLNRFNDKKDIINLIPIKEFSTACLTSNIGSTNNESIIRYNKDDFTIREYINAFIVGCSIQRILVFKSQKLLELMKTFSSKTGDYDEEELLIMRDYMILARDLFEKNIKLYLESGR